MLASIHAHTYAQIHEWACLVPAEARGGHWIPWTGITDHSEPWGLNPDSLQEQLVLLITEPSFQLLLWYS